MLRPCEICGTKYESARLELVELVDGRGPAYVCAECRAVHGAELLVEDGDDVVDDDDVEEELEDANDRSKKRGRGNAKRS